MKRTKRILKLVLSDIVFAYPYLLLFYLISLATTLFFSTWKEFFFWPGFTAIILILGIITIAYHWTHRSRKIKGSKKISPKKISTYFFIVTNTFKRIRRQDYVKIGIIFLVLAFFEVNLVGFLNLALVLYTCIVLLYGRGTKLSAIIAFVLLALCPLLIWLHVEEQISTKLAEYAYYLLIICLVGNMRIVLIPTFARKSPNLH
jgi:hypothetical protein